MTQRIATYHNNRNGYGITYGNSLDTHAEAYVPWFDDYETIVEAMQNAPMLLSGEPGAGKSHIAEDIIVASRKSGKESLQIWCHINGSSTKGREMTERLIGQLLEARSDGVLVLDNIDHAVYTGGNRKNKRSNHKALEYGKFLGEVMQEATSNDVQILATGHTPQWRQNHSRLEGVESVFRDMLPDTMQEIQFTGVMSEDNVQRILEQRGIDREFATMITRRLRTLGELSFRNAYHITPVGVTQEAIDEAVKDVSAVKNEKLHGGR